MWFLALLRLDPEDVMALLREYHAAIGGIINKYGGTLERYAGDGVSHRGFATKPSPGKS
jgi:class 3 adenylate cyclase